MNIMDYYIAILISAIAGIYINYYQSLLSSTSNILPPLKERLAMLSMKMVISSVIVVMLGTCVLVYNPSVLEPKGVISVMLACFFFAGQPLSKLRRKFVSLLS
jgi:hypothetical protein